MFGVSLAVPISDPAIAIAIAISIAISISISIPVPVPVRTAAAIVIAASCIGGRSDSRCDGRGTAHGVGGGARR
jgi:hypothetical protein